MTDGNVIMSVDGPPTNVKTKESHRLSIMCIMIVIVLYAPTAFIGQTTIRQYIMHNLMMQYNFTDPSHGKACLQFNDSHSRHEQKDVQHDGAVLTMAIVLCEAIFGMVASLLIGPLTDRFGRKLGLFSSLFGSIMRQGLNLLVIRLRLDMWFFVLTAAIDGIFGGLGTVALATVSYITDLVPSAKSRTFTIAIATGTSALMSGLASLGNGYLIQNFGYFYSTLWLFCSVITSELIVIFFLKESLKVRTRSWNLKKVLKPFTIYCQKGRSRKLLLYLIIVFLTHGALVPRANVLDLFLMDRPLCWESVNLGIFYTVNVITQWFIAMLAMKLLHQCCSDQIIVALGICSGIATDVLMAFANKMALVYTAVGIGFLFPIVNPTIKSIMSHEVNECERGTLFACVSCVEWGANIIFSIAFNTIYSETVATFHGTVFLFIASMILLAGCFLAYTIFSSRKTVQVSNNTD